MRNLIAVLLAWFLTVKSKRCGIPTAQPTPPSPAHRAPAAADPTAEEELCAEDVVLVRPYVVAWEQHVAREFERERQRDRRTAAAFAAMGADFLGVPA